MDKRSTRPRIGIGLVPALIEIYGAASFAFSPGPQTGPGKRTIHSLHRRIGTSKYMPHQGEQERARRGRQIAAGHHGVVGRGGG